MFNHKLLSLGLVSALAISVCGAAEPTVAKTPSTSGGFLKAATASSKSLQRTHEFFGIHSLKPHVQIAIVIDGTESMDKEIESLKEGLNTLVDNIQAIKIPGQPQEPKVELAIVVYRDSDSPSGTVQKVVPEFTTDLKSVQDKLAAVATEPGAPYFNERVDEGVFAGLELNWAPVDAKEDNTSRWMILIGDAPPYPHADEVTDPAKKERIVKEKLRLYKTEDLKAKALEKKIKIYTLKPKVSEFKDVKKSALNPALAQASQAENEATLRFFEALAKPTFGNSLDLRDEVAQRAFLEEGFKDDRMIAAISDDDIKSWKDKDKTGVPNSTLRTVAILPHGPLHQLDFQNLNSDAYLAATEMKLLFEAQGFTVKPISDLAEPWKKVAPKDATNDEQTREAIRNLGESLDKEEFICWGEIKKEGDRVSLKTSLFRSSDGDKIATYPLDSESKDKRGLKELATIAFRKLKMGALKYYQEKSKNPELAAAFVDPPKESPAAKALKNPTFTQNLEAHRAALAGLAALEKALQYAKHAEEPLKEGDSGSAEGKAEEERQIERRRNERKLSQETLKEAVKNFEDALRFEKSEGQQNPFVLLMLANCHYNLGPEGEQSQERQDFLKHLKLAYENRDQKFFQNTPMQIEIEAEYALFIDRDAVKALELYGKVLEHGSESAYIHQVRRAHWMRAGIFLGDWGVANYSTDRKNVLNPEKAREEILSILAFYPTTFEAKFYDQCRRDRYVPVQTRDVLASNP